VLGTKLDSSYNVPDQARQTPAAMATGVDVKLLKSTKFPPEFNQKVDMTKVNLQVMKKYVEAPFLPDVTQRCDEPHGSIAS
jgi:hypothetical protein